MVLYTKLLICCYKRERERERERETNRATEYKKEKEKEKEKIKREREEREREREREREKCSELSPRIQKKIEMEEEKAKSIKVTVFTGFL
jgi:hypothetical protein